MEDASRIDHVKGSPREGQVEGRGLNEMQERVLAIVLRSLQGRQAQVDADRINLKMPMRQ